MKKYLTAALLLVMLSPVYADESKTEESCIQAKGEMKTPPSSDEQVDSILLHGLIFYRTRGIWVASSSQGCQICLSFSVATPSTHRTGMKS